MSGRGDVASNRYLLQLAKAPHLGKAGIGLLALLVGADAWAEVAGHYTVTDRRAVDALSPFYVWTTDYAEKRLAWKRRHPLHVILLRTYRIPRPVTVKVRDEYGGCRSWLELTRELPFEGTPVLSDEEFERASEEIAAIASDRQPVLV